MARTIRTKVYKFNELSEKAKEKAIDEYRDDCSGDQPAWANENRQSMESFSDMLPIKVTSWEYGGRGEGVNFHFTERDEVEELTGHRLAKYIWNNYKTSLYKGKYYSLWSKTEKSYKYYKEGYPVLKSRYSKVFFEISCPFTGYVGDMAILDPIIEFMKQPRDITFKDLIEECFEAWVKYCNSDIEYQNSDEYLTEGIESNDYEFTADGRRF